MRRARRAAYASARCAARFASRRPSPRCSSRSASRSRRRRPRLAAIPASARAARSKRASAPVCPARSTCRRRTRVSAAASIRSASSRQASASRRRRAAARTSAPVVSSKPISAPASRPHRDSATEQRLLLERFGRHPVERRLQTGDALRRRRTARVLPRRSGLRRVPGRARAAVAAEFRAVRQRPARRAVEQRVRGGHAVRRLGSARVLRRRSDVGACQSGLVAAAAGERGVLRERRAGRAVERRVRRRQRVRRRRPARVLSSARRASARARARSSRSRSRTRGSAGTPCSGSSRAACAPSVTPCGGVDQRGCCIGEAGFGACQAGLTAVQQINSGQCANSLPGIQSSSVCKVVTACGGEGQRACCLGEAGFGVVSGGARRAAAGELGAVRQRTAGRAVERRLRGDHGVRRQRAARVLRGRGRLRRVSGGAGRAAAAELRPVRQLDPGHPVERRVRRRLGVRRQRPARVLRRRGGVVVSGGARRAAAAQLGSMRQLDSRHPVERRVRRDHAVRRAGRTRVLRARGGVRRVSGRSRRDLRAQLGPVRQLDPGHPVRRRVRLHLGLRRSRRARLLRRRSRLGLQRGPGRVPDPDAGQCGNLPFGIQSSGTCIPLSPCGGRGQRACCVGEGKQPCDAVLAEIPGCSGDCACGGGFASSGMCTVIAPIEEPATGWTEPAKSGDPLRGYADLHLHLFANLAHGGGVLAGAAFDPKGGVNAALREDYGTDLDLVGKDGSELGAADAVRRSCRSAASTCSTATTSSSAPAPTPSARAPRTAAIASCSARSRISACRSSTAGRPGTPPRTSRPTTCGSSAPGAAACDSR